MSPVSDPAYPSDVRAALLAAAHGELLEHGVSGLSLRAIAARAGVSRATPKWHFGDRAGLLTQLAAEGFRRLDAALRVAIQGLDDPASRFSALGRGYLDFGLDNPELFELMFRTGELRSDDPDLVAARERSFGLLVEVATASAPPGDGDGEVPLLAWAAAHGLVVLVERGALQMLAGLSGRQEAEDLAHHLADRFTALVAP